MVAALLLVAGLSAGQVFGATLYLSTLGLGEGATPGNASLTLNVGDSATLYLWADLTVAEACNGLGLDVLSSDPAVVEGTSSVIENPAVFGAAVPNFLRWNPPIAHGTPGDLVTGINAVAVGFDPVSGIQGNQLSGAFSGTDPTYNAGSGFLVGTFTLDATAAGVTEIKLAANDSLITGTMIGTDVAPLLHFGTGDAVVPTSVDQDNQYFVAAGATSTLADATIEVIPEPATLSLLALGGLALIRRR
jgi:hypothetical protein